MIVRQLYPYQQSVVNHNLLFAILIKIKTKYYKRNDNNHDCHDACCIHWCTSCPILVLASTSWAGSSSEAGYMLAQCAVPVIEYH